jgi:hypothetical protein
MMIVMVLVVTPKMSYLIMIRIMLLVMIIIMSW